MFNELLSEVGNVDNILTEIELHEDNFPCVELKSNDQSNYLGIFK